MMEIKQRQLNSVVHRSHILILLQASYIYKDYF